MDCKTTDMGFAIPEFPSNGSRKVEMKGYITGILVHGTEEGNLYEFRFKYSLKKAFPEISLATRNKKIYHDYYEQLFVTDPWKQLGADAPPPPVKALVDRTGVGFEVFKIEFL
jgi:hypothetical protein